MWRFRWLGKSKNIRVFVKWLFGLYFYNGRVVKILFGPLRGKLWVCNRAHQFWMPLGMYENETADWIISSLREGDTFLDIGANAGYFTLIGSNSVGGGEVIAFDPIPLNCDVIRNHINKNNITNVVLKEAAVSNTSGTVRFSVQENNANSHLSDISMSHAIEKEDTSIQVDSVTLDDYVSSTKIAPSVIKVDVEGAEKLVLEGAKTVLRDFNSLWIISTHSSNLYKECKIIMESYGYVVDELVGFHHELICRKL